MSNWQLYIPSIFFIIYNLTANPTKGQLGQEAITESSLQNENDGVSGIPFLIF